MHSLCGGVAFYVTKKPGPGANLDPSNTVLLDGTHPKRDDKVVCGCCGASGVPTCHLLLMQELVQ